MGWAERSRKGCRVGIVGEDGKPLEAANDETKPNPAEVIRKAQIEALSKLIEPWDGDADVQASLAKFLIEHADDVREILAPNVGPKVEIGVKPDGNLSIVGPPDPRLVLRMLHEATDLVQMGTVRKAVMEQMAQGIAKPGLRDVLAFSKVRP